ncbi:TetR family transcriptional regulator [Kineococcus sp. SYSU DK001]|uniref:TetR family transcriptional regulator n=1 Tax=Kineococcus sp. SYSU DK001 TaxID=3383122 RepID=UPI003D7D7E0F
MPRIVDHDARRAELVTTSLRLVAGHGIEAVDSRSVSAATGTSAGSLWNHFPSTDHLVAAASTRVLRRDASDVTHEGAQGADGRPRRRRR